MFVTVVTSLTLIVFPVAAQITQVSGNDCSGLGINCTGNEDTSSLIQTIGTIVEALLALVGIVAAIYLVLGGVRYILSEGDENKAEKAKNTILYAIIGIIVIGLSALIVNYIIQNVLGVQGGSNTGNPTQGGQQFIQIPISSARQ